MSLNCQTHLKNLAAFSDLFMTFRSKGLKETSAEKQYFAQGQIKNRSLREKRPNTEFSFMFVFSCIWILFTQWIIFIDLY